MKIGKKLYTAKASVWRAWLAKNHDNKNEIWLVFYKKDSGKARLPYNEAVDEALCYGWIDSIVKRIDDKSFAQRFSPRKSTSNLSALNRERVNALIKKKKMTKFGLAAISHKWNDKISKSSTLLPTSVVKVIKNNSAAWKNFQKFPQSYKRIRTNWIYEARVRPEEYKKRLKYFLKMTEKNKRFGMVQ